MNPRHFDRMTRLFADRRFSRRQALATGGLGLAGVAAASTGFVAAQDATPGAATPRLTTDSGEKISYLFVQTFQSGTISAASDASDTHTHSVTLQGGSGQTVYFADRPARDVGAVPTDQFFTGLGFEAENPPNAAMVLEIENGDTDIAVVELYNPAIGDDGSVSYDVGELDTWRATLDMDFSEQPTDLADLAPSFGAAHLFIDDCADGDPVCWNYPERNGVNLGTRGRCWSWAGLRCTWCFIEQYARECNEMFPDHCKGECYVEG